MDTRHIVTLVNDLSKNIPTELPNDASLERLHAQERTLERALADVQRERARLLRFQAAEISKGNPTPVGNFF